MKSEDKVVKTVFLSGTDQVKDILNHLHNKLLELGLEPWWHGNPSFPQLNSDAMTNCVEAAKRCDMMLLILDGRSGLPYHHSHHSVTEEEFNVAFANYIPVFAFVRANIWANSIIYHRHLSDKGSIDSEEFKALKLDGDQEVYNFIGRIMHKKRAGEPEVIWTRPFQKDDEILSFVQELYKSSEGRIKLSKENNTSEDSENLLLEDNLATETLYSEQEYIELIFKFNDALPPEIQNNIFRDVITYGWRQICCNPFTAANILQDKRPICPILNTIVSPLCNSAIRKSIDPSAFLTFISTITTRCVATNELTSCGNLLIARLLRHLIYSQPEIQNAPEWHQAIAQLASKNDVFWDKLFTDLYLRYECDYVELSLDSLSVVETAAARYCKNYSEKPLAILWPLIVSPLKYSTEHNSDAMLGLIMGLAERCEDGIDSRWCITALMRVFPLYEVDDYDDDFSVTVSALVEKMDKLSATTSISIQFFYLRHLLKAFIRTKQIHYLRKYEIRFSGVHKSLLQTQICNLQIEYVAALLLAIDFSEDNSASDLKHFIDIVQQNLIQTSPLFRNTLIATSYKMVHQTKETDISRKAIRKLLHTYLTELYNLSCKHLIERNHLKVLEYKIETQIYSHRPNVMASVVKSLKSHNDSSCKRKKSFYSKSLSVFRYIDKGHNKELVFDYVSKAIAADDYSIHRNAIYYLECLFFCFYYGDMSNRGKVKEFADFIAKKTEIGKAQPLLYWVYYAGIILHESCIEMEFIQSLYKQNNKPEHFPETTPLNRLSIDPFRFYDANRDIISHYASRDSLFAKVLMRQMNHPEAWNSIATSIFNLKDTNDNIAFLNMAAYFYSFAQTFSKSAQMPTQKFYFNFIRCKSLALLASAKPRTESFIADTAIYLHRPDARYFAFKADCIAPFVELINKWKPDISSDSVVIFDGLINDVEWIRTSILKKPAKRFKNEIKGL